MTDLDTPPPYHPEPGDHAIATDAHGTDHNVTITQAPYRGHTMVLVGLRFDDLPAHQHTTMVWPLTAVRPRPGDSRDRPR